SGSAYGHALAVYQRHRAANYLFLLCRVAGIRHRHRQNSPPGRPAAVDD
ncbi:p-aminobenzoyl-glutamate transporter, partial [Klebsiella pneumoniae]